MQLNVFVCSNKERGETERKRRGSGESEIAINTYFGRNFKSRSCSSKSRVHMEDKWEGERECEDGVGAGDTHLAGVDHDNSSVFLERRNVLRRCELSGCWTSALLLIHVAYSHLSLRL